MLYENKCLVLLSQALAILGEMELIYIRMLGNTSQKICVAKRGDIRICDDLSLKSLYCRFGVKPSQPMKRH